MPSDKSRQHRVDGSEYEEIYNRLVVSYARDWKMFSNPSVKVIIQQWKNTTNKSTAFKIVLK